MKMKNSDKRIKEEYNANLFLSRVFTRLATIHIGCAINKETCQ
jgi:hypothetical protein